MKITKFTLKYVLQHNIKEMLQTILASSTDSHGCNHVNFQFFRDYFHCPIQLTDS